MSSEDSLQTMPDDNTTDGQAGPVVRELYHHERPTGTSDKLNRRFEDAGGQHGLEMYLRRDLPAEKAMQRFAESVGKEAKHYRFIFEGTRLTGEEMPNES